MEFLRKFWADEDGIGVVEIILILVVLIGLVLIFKNQLNNLVNGIFSKIQSQTNQIY
ncbi:MAG: holin, BlyA family protein [Clostridiales bacterium]|nr:holin, BlyA family protein [Clostridiales bacterium]